MTAKSSSIFVAAALAFGLAAGAAAQSSGTTTSDTTAALEAQTAQMDSLAVSRGESTVIGKTADTFTDFAGSRENAVSLATGLRTGSEITLTGSSNGAGESTTFTPPTKPMGHGNVFKSLALAQDQLAQHGIDNPTPQQIETALNGGTITVGEGADAETVTFAGVLQQRADGMGWGQIAQAQGTKLGWVVGGMKSANAAIAKQPKVASTTATSNASAGAGITTAGGTSGSRGASSKDASGAKGKGVVNAAGGSVGGSGAAHGNRGVQNAMGGGNAYGHSGGHGKANGRGAGIVTATGAGAGGSASSGGIVSAGGGTHGGAAAAAHGRGGGVVNAGGGQGGGNAHGLAKGQR